MRRYLDALVGNESLRGSLGKSIEGGALHHALLIEGPAGSGKRTLALQIAAAEVCENKASTSYPLPCGVCRACRLVLSGNAPDVTFISRGGRATLGVEAVRDAKEDMFLSPTEFPVKFYIFEDAHTMTVQAQNALLIVLEEPPQSTKIMLLSEESEAMLVTIRSRARLLRMEALSPAVMKRYFEEKEPSLLLPYQNDEAGLTAALLAANGRLGEARRYLSPEGKAELKESRDMTDALLASMTKDASFGRLCDAFGALPTKREPLAEALRLLHLALRDLILFKKAENAPLLYCESAEVADGYSRSVPLPRLLYMADRVMATVEDIEKNANVQTALTLLKCDLCR